MPWDDDLSFKGGGNFSDCFAHRWEPKAERKSAVGLIPGNLRFCNLTGSPFLRPGPREHADRPLHFQLLSN